MAEKIKSAFEKAMEKIAAAGELTAEEREKLRHEEKIKMILADFYRGKLSRETLWSGLKGSPAPVLTEFQRRLVDSIRLTGLPQEFEQRSDGILAVEALKPTPNTAGVEQTLHSIIRLMSEFTDGKEQALEELKQAVEQNPHLRMRPMRTRDGKTVMQPALSVDEAVQARMSEFLPEHEKRYELLFGRMLEKLRRDLGIA